MSFWSNIKKGLDVAANVAQSPIGKIAISAVPGGAVVNTILGSVLAVEHSGILDGTQKKEAVMQAVQAVHPDVSPALLNTAVEQVIQALNEGNPAKAQALLEKLTGKFESWK